MKLRRALAAVTSAGALVVATGGLASADDIHNSIDGSIDATAEVMPLNVGGANGVTTLAVEPANGDGKNGCNLTGSTTFTVNVSSSNESVATVSPSTVTFTSCGDTHDLTVTPVSAGSTTISLTAGANTTSGTFNLAPATFDVNVTGQANSAPTLSISGVTEGAAYDFGSVPTATCQVSDAEDGTSSFAATLSAITGPDAANGIGSQTASCSYTDGGGLRAAASVTYSIVDTTAPTISQELTPAEPDGLNGWYKGAVTLKWTVTENESTSTLTTSGCDPVTIDSDQLPQNYVCSASSAGGTATPQTVTIKRDGTGPTVADDGVVSGTHGDNGWYTSDVTVRFTATDEFSGPVVDHQDASTTGEGSAVTVASPEFADNAGNVTPAGTATSAAFKVDKSKPHDVAFVGGPVDGGSYYFGSVPDAPTCTADDDVSGLASCEVTGDADPASVGTHTYTATATDHAGLQETATATYTVLAWTDTGFYAPVNMGAVLNTVKGGSTVPLKFNVYSGATELTDPRVVKNFTTQRVACDTGSGTSDPVEVTTTGGTSLRYDASGDQFIQNWKTPTGAGTCHSATMTTLDGSKITALFKIK